MVTASWNQQQQINRKLINHKKKVFVGNWNINNLFSFKCNTCFRQISAAWFDFNSILTVWRNTRNSPLSRGKKKNRTIKRQTAIRRRTGWWRRIDDESSNGNYLKRDLFLKREVRRETTRIRISSCNSNVSNAKLSFLHFRSVYRIPGYDAVFDVFNMMETSVLSLFVMQQ